MTTAGHNNHCYRLNYRWGTGAAAQLKVKDCHEMVIDSKGLLYLLTNEVHNNILVYDKSGTLKKSWTLHLPGAHGLTLHKQGSEEFLFITDTELNKVCKTTMDGRWLQTISYPKEAGIYENGALYKPTETAVAPNGDIYVTDGYGLQYIIQYNHEGKYIRHWGGKGSGSLSFDCAHGIAIDNRNESNPTLLITSRNENCFKRFTMNGVYIETIHLPGSFVCRPVVHGDNVYAAVFRSQSNQLPGSGYITILDENNKVVSTPGGTAPLYINGVLQAQQQQQQPLFVHPHDVCVDDEGSLYIAQWNAGNTFPVQLQLVNT